MFSTANFWQLLAGLGLFLFAMAQLEIALASVSGPSLKAFLRRRTSTPLAGVLTGTTVTAMVQSSSLVGLMVLAFTGAGLMPLKNALGVIFGSNLGTTFTGWIVATLGFKLDLESLSLPLIGIGSLTLLIARGKTSELGRVAAALGLLLLGLSFMKDSVSAIRAAVDPATIVGLQAWQYLLFGVVFAGIVQSSSATMMVALAALDGGLISLPAAAAVAIGADLGTTTTIIIGSLQGAAAKRRVAVAHFSFNLLTDALAFFLRLPLLSLIALGIDDPLLALVAFHSLFNLLGICLFLPFTSLLARRLERLFTAAPSATTRYVHEVSPGVPEAAMGALETETADMLAQVVAQNMQAFTPPLPLPPGRSPVGPPAPEIVGTESFDALYRRTKRLEGEILAFATRLQGEPLSSDESQRLQQLLSAIRCGVQSSKHLKDIHHNLDEFRNSPESSVNSYLQHVHSVMTTLYGELFTLRGTEGDAPLAEDLAEIIREAHARHDQLHQDIFSDIRAARVSDHVVSSLLNVNRELLNSNLALLTALAHFYLSEDQAESIALLPGNS